MPRMLRWLTIGLLSVAACTSGSESTETTSAAQPASDGRLAVVDGSGNIVVLNPDGSNQLEVTSDGGDVFYVQPTWSPDGRSLAWGRGSSEGAGVDYGTPEDGSVGSVSTIQLPFYLFWSPDSSKVGVLHNGVNDLEFEMVDTDAGTSNVLASGAPYYFAWSPDSAQLVAHAESVRFEAISPSGDSESLGQTDEGYLNPVWTESGIFYVNDNELQILSGQQSQRIIDVGEFTTFVVSPDAKKVAMQSANVTGGVTVSLEAQAVQSNILTVVDVESGETEAVTDEPAFAYFWSPEGNSLLIMTVNEAVLELEVWTEGEGVIGYGAFTPSVTLARDVLPFFTQYALSMSLWSPDSSAFAYPANDGIWVQSLDGSDPTRVSDGGWVAWSN